MTHPKDKYYTYENGKCQSHRPPVKLVVNPVLRRAQFWMKHPWVIASITDIDDDGKAHFGGYVFKRQGLK